MQSADWHIITYIMHATIFLIFFYPLLRQDFWLVELVDTIKDISHAINVTLVIIFTSHKRYIITLNSFNSFLCFFLQPLNSFLHFCFLAFSLDALVFPKNRLVFLIHSRQHHLPNHFRLRPTSKSPL